MTSSKGPENYVIGLLLKGVFSINKSEQDIYGMKQY